jgi:predicted ThiF/HesA family dinucleotide-utilizing enzyme
MFVAKVERVREVRCEVVAAVTAMMVTPVDHDRHVVSCQRREDVRMVQSRVCDPVAKDSAVVQADDAMVSAVTKSRAMLTPAAVMKIDPVPGPVTVTAPGAVVMAEAAVVAGTIGREARGRPKSQRQRDDGGKDRALVQQMSLIQSHDPNLPARFHRPH